MKLDVSIPVMTVFLQGLLSFFSPCVLPLIPVYIGYLSGGTKEYDEQGKIRYNKVKVLVNTFFFVIGVSFAFFLLGFVMTGVGRFFSGNQLLFARIGGIIVVMFGLYQLGILGSNSMLSREHRLSVRFEKMSASPLTALIMGFVLSFAWTPCVGPALSTVLIMASTTGTTGTGFMLIAVYTIGYVIPFMAVGLFTTQLLEFFRNHRSVLKYTVKIGGVLMILMGAMMFSGSMNRITGYMTTIAAESNATIEDNEVPADVNNSETPDYIDKTEESTESTGNSGSENDTKQEYTDAPDFSLSDQYGNIHALSDYNDKIIFLNFWATWCPPCRAELPYIQELYEEYSTDEDSDVVILGVTFPGLGNEQDIDGVKDFLTKNGYTFPVLLDENASLMVPYYINSFPTTFIILPGGKVLGYIPGGMTKDIMQDVIEQAKGLI